MIDIETDSVLLLHLHVYILVCTHACISLGVELVCLRFCTFELLTAVPTLCSRGLCWIKLPTVHEASGFPTGYHSIRGEMRRVFSRHFIHHWCGCETQLASGSGQGGRGGGCPVLSGRMRELGPPGPRLCSGWCERPAISTGSQRSWLHILSAPPRGWALSQDPWTRV